MVFKGDGKMNLAFFVERADNSHQDLFKFLNEAVAEYKDHNFSVFYNDLDQIAIPTNFAMFNATELWSFTGVLICLGLNNTARASRVINKFQLLHMFDKSDKESLFNIISLLDQEHVKVIAKDEESAKEFYRVTGVKPEYFKEFSVDEILAQSLGSHFKEEAVS